MLKNVARSQICQVLRVKLFKFSLLTGRCLCFTYSFRANPELRRAKFGLEKLDIILWYGAKHISIC